MKTLNMKTPSKGYEMLPLEQDFSFDEVANEICIGDSEPTKGFDQMCLDGPNDSKFMIMFQYSDLDKHFIDEDIFYSEEIEVKEEREDNLTISGCNDVGSMSASDSHITPALMDVQNEVVIGKDGSMSEGEGYGQVIKSLLPSANAISVPSDPSYHKKRKYKEKPYSSDSSLHCIITPTESNENPKSLFGSSMGVSKCSICNKYTKRSCYDAHMKEHYESDFSKISGITSVADKEEDPLLIKESDLASSDSESKHSTNSTFSHSEESEDQKFSCSQCDYFSFTKEELDHHLKLHECQKLNKCPHCNYESAQMITMKAHIKSHESIMSFECTKCTYRTTEKAHFTRHMRRHTGEKPFKCNLCGYSAVQGSALKSHIRRHYGEKPHVCPFCDYKSVERTSLVRHVRVHTGEKPHTCPFCDYKSIQKSSLKAHLKKHSGEHHQCDKCEFKTVQKTCLARHLKRHRAEKPHKCKLCNYQSIQKASLRTHMRRHTGEKPFHCPHCEYSCVEKTHLNRHLRQHTGERPIFCFVCDYRCIQFSSLASHMKRHEGILITCAFCQFKSVKTDALLKHVKSEHKGTWKVPLRNLNCPLCEFKCITKEQHDLHMRSHIESFAEDAANAFSEKVHRCSHCDFQTISKKHLKAHRAIHKSTAENTDTS